MKLIRAHWAAILSVLAVVGNWAFPALHALAASNPNTTEGVILTAFLAAFYDSRGQLKTAPQIGRAFGSKAITGLLLFGSLAFAPPAHAQNTATPPASVATSSASPTGKFSLTTNAIALPGNSVTLAGTEDGMTLNVTKNVQLRDDNVAAPGLQFFGAGINYFLPQITSATLGGSKILFYLTFNLGADRIAVNGAENEHWAALAGGGFLYQVGGSSTWNIGAEIKYARLPGFATNTAIVEVGPTINF